MSVLSFSALPKPRDIVPSDSRLYSPLFFSLFSFLVFFSFFLFFSILAGVYFLGEQCVCVCPFRSSVRLSLFVSIVSSLSIHADTYVCVSTCACARESFLYRPCTCMCVGERTMEQDVRGVALSHAEKRVTASMDHSALLAEIDRPK